MVVVTALLGALVGCSLGADLASDLGTFGKLIGGLIGAVAGFLGTIVSCVLMVAALSPLDWLVERIGRWWCPFPPICESGTCMKETHYTDCEIAEEVVARVRGLCRRGHCCRCGNVYATGYDYGMQRRFIRVLPDGAISPYLRHRVFGRWRVDDGRGIVEIVPGMEVDRPPREVPGWTIPCFTTVLAGGIAFYVVYLNGDVEPDPAAPWFVLAATAVGLIGGLVRLWIGPPGGS
jgi:hypothetical protein